MKPIAITTDTREAEAAELARLLDLPLCARDSKDYAMLLVLTDTHLALSDPHQPKLKPIYVDFASGKLMHRQRFGGGRGQLIARAVGLKPGITPSVLDVTAGMGEDAFVLATLGCQVTMLERHPVVAALLRDGLTRLGTTSLSLTLIEADAITYLTTGNRTEVPDVIYLDPMFPERDKTALVKKEMRLLRELVGKDTDAKTLLDIARHAAKKRVVVKRPRLAPKISDLEPDVVFSGKSCRFDVYLA